MQTQHQATTGSSGGASAASDAGFLRSPLVIGLGTLLAVQLIAALIMGLGGSNLSPAESEGPLLAFDAEKVSRLRIASADQETVLEKSDAGWLIPSLGGFPASELKVTDLLGKLAGIQKRIPVATSEAAAERFKVDDEGFERRLVLEGEAGPLGILYLGDSPGFRRLFLRADADQAVYEAELALFDASEKADDWTKKTVLQLEQERIQAITIGDLSLARGEDGSWALNGLIEGETLNQEAVEDLVRMVANLNFQSVLGTEDKQEYGQETPTLTLKVVLEDGTLDYLFSKLADSEDQVLKVSNRPHYFLVSQYGAADLTDVTRDRLVAGSEEATTEGSEGDPASVEQAEDGAGTGTPAQPAGATADVVGPTGQTADSSGKPPATGEAAQIELAPEAVPAPPAAKLESAGPTEPSIPSPTGSDRQQDVEVPSQ